MPDISSFSKNKIIFFVGGAVLLLVLIIGFSMISSPGGSKKPKIIAPKELSVWVVGDETAWFSDIVTGFKKRYPEYGSTDVKFTKFGNYADYEKTLLTVIGDGNSPDIFVVNSNGGTLLESKIQGIPADIVNPEEFQKNFNKIFDDLEVSQKEKDDSGKERTVFFLKGIPLWYQALGVFYNWKLIRTVPHLWSEIGKKNTSTSSVTSTETPIAEDSGSPDYTDIMLGFDGKHIVGMPDIISLFLLQNKIDSYSKFSDPQAVLWLNNYLTLSGSADQETLAHIQSVMTDLNLTTVDLFVRGKIGMVVGFPSLLREIEYAIKRAGTENVLSGKSLRTSEIPEPSNDPKEWVNLGEYNYFALSRTSKNSQAGYTFLAYLYSREAEEKYLEKFPTYLPAQVIFEEKKLDEQISPDYERVKYRSFMNPDTDLHIFDKGLKNEYDAYFSNISRNTKKESKDVLMGVNKYVDCNKKHLVDVTSFEEECKLE